MKLRVTVNGTAYEVNVELLDQRAGAPPNAPPVTAPRTPATLAAPVAAPAPASDKTLSCPIPGTVVEIMAKVGQSVQANAPVIILDAMKMNTQVSATMDGVIQQILVKPGDPVKMGQILMVFE